MATAKTRRHKNGKDGKRRGNHTGTLSKRGNIYLAQWYVLGEDGIRHRVSKSTGTSDIDEARAFLDAQTRELNLDKREKMLDSVLNAKKVIGVERQQIATDRKAEEDAKPALAIKDGFEAFRKSPRRKDCRERTLVGYESQYDAFIEWAKTHTPPIVEMRKVTDVEAGEFSVHICTTKSANTHNKYVTLLAYIWNVLEKEARITDNPWERIAKKSVTTHIRRELTVEELTRVCEGLQGEMRILFALGIYTGLRLGDCATMGWGKIDLVRGLLTTNPHKTDKTFVRIPLHPTLAGMLSEIPEKKRRGFVLPETAEIYGRNASVLTNRIQKHFRTCGIQTGGKPARLYKKHGTYRFELQERDDKGRHIVEDTKLTDLEAARALFAKRFGSSKRDRVDVGFHSLRHTFVSLSANAGVPLAVVQSIVGHSNPVMTRHYFHASDDALKGAVAAIPDVIESPAEAAPLPPPAEKDKLSTIRDMVATLADAELVELAQFVNAEIKRRSA